MRITIKQQVSREYFRRFPATERRNKEAEEETESNLYFTKCL